MQKRERLEFSSRRKTFTLIALRLQPGETNFYPDCTWIDAIRVKKRLPIRKVRTFLWNVYSLTNKNKKWRFARFCLLIWFFKKNQRNRELALFGFKKILKKRSFSVFSRKGLFHAWD